MKQKFLPKLLLVAILLFCTLYANAYSFETDGIYYNVVSSTDLTCEVTYRTDRGTHVATYTGIVSIPETVTRSSDGNTYTVVGIGSYTFWADSITEIMIPTTVTYIDNYAFLSCDKLTSVTIPKSVITIGREAFYGCI